MSGSGIIPTSAIAATNSGNKIRVYFQAYNGEIRESKTNNGSTWTTLSYALPYPTKPKTFTPLAATNYANLGELRIYYLDVNHKMQEVCWSDSRNEWFAGGLNNGNFHAASYSQLAVVHWDDQFRVYYQRASDNRILELVRSGTNAWTAGATLPEAIPGSRLAAIRTSDGHLRVYYQGTDFSLHQVTTVNNWGDDTVIAPTKNNTPSETSISAIAFGQAIRLYYTPTPGNRIQELAGTTGGNNWSNASTLNTSIPKSYTASVSWGSIDAIRVYSMFSSTRLGEMNWGEGGNWREGTGVPTA